MSRAPISAQGGQRPSERVKGLPVARRASTRRAVVLAVIASAASVLGAASAADARTVTTQYYTINVAAPTPSSSGLFLGTQDHLSRRPVRLTRYIPGDVYAHWAPIYHEWPGAAPVTGSSPVLDAFTCGGLPLVGCPFQGRAWRPPGKFVNRGSGMCLTLGHPWAGNGTKVHQIRCAPGTAPNSFQLWERTYTVQTPFVQVKANWPRCLDVTEFRNVTNTPLQGWSCQEGPPWNQRFRLLPVAQVTCEIGVTTNLCGLARQP